LCSQPVHFLKQLAVLHAQGSRLAACARQLLCEDRQDATKLLQPVE
jgi:hypothetical protein